MSNIFEDLFNCCDENTKAPFKKYQAFTAKVSTYCKSKQPNRNPKEEFVTQVFVNIMLEDALYRK